MLSLFPGLLSWSQVSPFIIRLTLGCIFLHWSYIGLRGRSGDTYMKLLAVCEGALGILLIIGLWTQLAAGLIAIDLIVRIAGRIRSKAFLTDGVNYYLILLVLALSLLVTGAGIWGFDYSI